MSRYAYLIVVVLLAVSATYWYTLRPMDEESDSPPALDVSAQEQVSDRNDQVLGQIADQIVTYPPSRKPMANTPKSNKPKSYAQAPKAKSPSELKQSAKIQMKSGGTIEIKFYPDDAPLAVTNFQMLASDGFYDGLTFHRREEGFVIQGGDPIGNGTGGPGYRFEDEPVMRKYTRGIVAMANAGPDTNGSQFFIMLGDVPLPPSYTIFGEVISGMEVVDAVRKGDVMTSVVLE